MIYIDNAASYLGNKGEFNVNSVYADKRKKDIEQARKTIATIINCDADEIYFTSGGCEANSWVLQRINTDKRHIITTKIEHSSTMNCCKWLEKHGYEVTYLDVDQEGHISLEDLESAITDDTFLISIIHINNEIGSIQPIYEIGKIAHKYGVYFHVDATQSIAHVKFDVKEWNIDLLTASGHKFAKHNGVGFLYCSKDVPLEPLIFGGSQERGIRGGTTNYKPIVEMADALNWIFVCGFQNKGIDLANYFIGELAQLPYQIRFNNYDNSSIVSVSFKGVDAEALMMFLADFNVYVSAGSACNTDHKEPSHVLKAIKVPDEYIDGTLRFSFSELNTTEQIDKTVQLIKSYLKYGANNE